MKILNVPFEAAEDRNVSIPLSVPETCILKEYARPEQPAVADVGKAVLQAVENPIHSAKFSELIRGKKTVLFMIENQFRQAPAYQLLPPLVEMVRKAGAEPKIIIGSGKVGSLDDDEIKEKIGSELFQSGIAVTCNDVAQADNYAFEGVTERGIPIWVHRWVAEADVKVTIGTTQATLWGYGGSGMVIPGTANNETIEMNHIMSLAPTCVPGNNETPMQLDKYEALHMCGINMGINVIVNNRFEVTAVNAGEPEESHRLSVKEYEKIYQYQIAPEDKADIVICGSTSPTDHLFFHTSWAVVNVDPVTKDDGTIIFASPCPGYHAWEGFALMDLMKAYMPPTEKNMEAALKDFYSHKKELWAGCIWYKVYELMVRKQTKYITLEQNLNLAHDVGLDASAPNETQHVFDELLKKYGPSAKVAFVPYGRYTVFSEKK